MKKAPNNFRFWDKWKADVVMGCTSRVLDRSRPTEQRVIWVFILITFTSLASYFISERFKYFLSNPVLADIYIEESSSLPFPAVTLCQNFKTNTEPNWEALDDQERLVMKVLQHQIIDAGKYKFYHNFTAEEMEDFDWESFLQTMWPPLRLRGDEAAAPSGCLFVESLTAQLYGTPGCSESDFVRTVNSDLHTDAFRMPCYTSERPDWRTVGNDGFLYMSLDKLAPGGIQVLNYIAVHQADESPRMFSDAIKLEPPKTNETLKYVIRWRRKDIVMVEPRCYAHGGSRFLAHFDSYSHERCKTECFLNYTMSVAKYNCHLPFGLEYYNASDICLPQDWNFYKRNAKKEFIFSNKLQECGCLPLCHQEIYQIDVEKTKSLGQRAPKTASTNSSAAAAAGAEGDSDSDSPSSSFITVFLKYQSGQVERIQQKYAVTIYVIIAQTGGLLSLLMGMRLVSFVEMLDVAVVGLLTRWRISGWWGRGRIRRHGEEQEHHEGGGAKHNNNITEEQQLQLLNGSSPSTEAGHDALYPPLVSRAGVTVPESVMERRERLMDRVLRPLATSPNGQVRV